MNDTQTPTEHQLARWLCRQTAPSAARRVLSLNAALACEQGIVRRENQDRVVFARGRMANGRTFLLAALADGIGGLQDGALSAATAIAGFVSEVQSRTRSNTNSKELLERAALRANRLVNAQTRGRGGATLVSALWVEGDVPHWVSVGDSRVYQFGQGNLLQVSVDDTIAGQLGKVRGENLDQQSLLQYIGLGDGLEPHIGALPLGAPSLILLTSDGVHTISQFGDLFNSVVANAGDAHSCARRLSELSKWCGGKDNASVAILSVESLHPGGAQDPHVLEVWDAFGEIQIVFPPISAVAVPAQRTPTPLEKLEERATQKLRGVSKPAPRKTKKKKISPEIARESSTLGDSEPVAAEEAPQVVIEFPGKE